MSVYWKVLGGIGTLVVGAATVLATLAAFGVKWDEIQGFLLPDGVLLLTGVGVVLVVVGLVVAESSSKPRSVQGEAVSTDSAPPDTSSHAADQAVLDDLLTVFNRASMRRIADASFSEGWSNTTMSPVTVYVHESLEVEHQFLDSTLEASRQALAEAAQKFAKAEAMNGFVHTTIRGRRNTGYAPGEAEGIPKREANLERRSKTISEARFVFTDAHDALVSAARARGYSVAALAADRPDRVRELDAIYEDE